MVGAVRELRYGGLGSPEGLGDVCVALGESLAEHEDSPIEG
jgi:hypothetical protein